MVNITCLKRFINQINPPNGGNGLPMMTAWSERSMFRTDRPTMRQRNTLRLIKDVRVLLNHISGENIVEMLKGKNI